MAQKAQKAKKKAEAEEHLTRIAIVSNDKCKPKKCRQECKKSCPVNRQGKLCIEVDADSKIAFISETLCIGCGICVRKCPFNSIAIINLPKSLEKDCIHRFGANGFKLHRLPMPRPGQVLGLVGTNGIGKSTALKILQGKLKPNFGLHEETSWESILLHFRGSELQNYFTHLLEDKLKSVFKPQYVDLISKNPSVKDRTVISVLNDFHNHDPPNLNFIIDTLDMEPYLNHQISTLSGGELQRFAIATACIQEKDIYMFDEPSSYLDVRQRLRACIAIRSLLKANNYVIVVEHDLAVLDYLSDFICCLYGKPAVYGVITMPFSVREGINIFLSGFVPTENLRFRDYELSFKIAEKSDEPMSVGYATGSSSVNSFSYPNMAKTFNKGKNSQFQLSIKEGSFSTSEIIVLLGRNGTGKTTFINMLAGFEKPDDSDESSSYSPTGLHISYKPQQVPHSWVYSVRDLLLDNNKGIRSMLTGPAAQQFKTDVLVPLKIEELYDLNVNELSGGELQRVAIALCLGRPAQLYLIDEPSAYLDSEQRIITAKVIKRFILHSKRTAFVVEHDFIMATYLADRVIVYEGEPSKACSANPPQLLVAGMNHFLHDLEITFRRDPTNYRPRINKKNSRLDTEQRRVGQYFFVDTDYEKTSEKD